MSDPNEPYLIEEHNAWVDKLKADVEFEPLLEFLDRLKELPNDDEFQKRPDRPQGE